MKFILNTSTDAYLNLALEEALIKTKLEEPILMLWRNRNAVIIGRHQNTLEEINTDCIDKNNISVVRRMSGGGAVYHDLGNINYSVIFDKNAINYDNMSFAASPIIDFMKSIRVPISLEGRNDIILDGKKVSGIAKYIGSENCLYHGTLLFDTDIDMLTSALTPNIKKLESKSIKSVRSRVGNIRDYVYMDREEFFSEIYSYFSSHFLKYDIDEQTLVSAYKLRKDKYSAWQWNYGNSPKYNYKNEIQIKSGIISVFFMIEDGVIKECSIRGDFFAKKDIYNLEKMFIDVKHDKNEIWQKIADIDAASYFIDVSEKDIMNMFFQE